tara:strand:+ start:273 stop:524 length:252 start_codon:yes stop_codon:yes gene_type:complete
MKTVRLSSGDAETIKNLISDRLVRDKGNEKLLRIKRALGGKYEKSQTIHSTVRDFEVGRIDAAEMVTRIMLLTGVDDCDIRQD